MLNIDLNNPDDIALVRNKLNENLREFGKTLGVNFEIGRITYGADCMTAKLSCTKIKPNGSIVKKEQVDFENRAHRYKMSPSDLGRKFHFNGKIFVLVGAKPQNRKYPIIGEDRAGKRFKFASLSVREGFNELDDGERFLVREKVDLSKSGETKEVQQVTAQNAFMVPTTVEVGDGW